MTGGHIYRCEAIRRSCRCKVGSWAVWGLECSGAGSSHKVLHNNIFLSLATLLLLSTTKELWQWPCRLKQCGRRSDPILSWSITHCRAPCGIFLYVSCSRRPFAPGLFSVFCLLYGPFCSSFVAPCGDRYCWQSARPSRLQGRDRP